MELTIGQQRIFQDYHPFDPPVNQSLDGAVEKTREIIEFVCKKYKPVKIVAGFSGGTDSLCAAHILCNDFDAELLFIDTGIGLQKTRNYVYDFSNKNNFNLNIKHAKDDAGEDYEEIVLEHGFPGHYAHKKFMYPRLKERAIRCFVREEKSERMDKIFIGTGIQSNIRAGYGNQIVTFVGAQMWVNVMYWWTKQLKYEYITRNNLWVNPVYKILGMSCECLCGSHAGAGELDLITMVEPETGTYLKDLQHRVYKAGFNWGWEESPPEEQDDKTEDLFQPMCVGCGKTEVAN